MCAVNLNHCRCGNRPEVVTQANGLVRIACVLGKCDEIVCAKADVAERVWNEINPADELPTLRQNEIPTAIDLALPEDWSEV
jgi:hypothetical protein